MPITVSAKIKASEELIWDCLTNPDHIVNWNFASPDWCCPSAQVDLQPGGRFNIRMEARDGSMGFDFSGTYRNVTPASFYSYTLDDQRNVEVNLERKDGAVETTHKFDPENQNPEDMQRAGWQAILDNLKTYCESISTAS